MHVDDDMLSDLVKAVYAGDLAKAQGTLDLIRATSGERLSGLIMRARCAVHPLPAALPVKPMKLPLAGHVPGDTLAGVRFACPDKEA